MTSQFTWIPIYQELADELVKWQDRQTELIKFLENLRDKEFKVTPVQDQDEEGARFLLKEIDPFTFFGSFNRQTREEERIRILSEIKDFFSLENPLPTDFDGIPVLNNQKSWFFSNSQYREISDIEKLWRVYILALKEKPLKNQEFLDAFDEAMGVRGVNINLTMGLFWIRPYTFLNLDQRNREYLQVNLPKGGLTSKYYYDFIQENRSQSNPFPEISYNAWLFTQGTVPKPSPGKREDVEYWLVGAYWDSRDPSDQTDRFVSEGIWVNGFEDRFLEDVRSMNVNDKIAIKSAFTQKNNLPFDNRNHTVSVMTIKAIGTIVANRGDGRRVEVEWDPDFEPKTWYFYTFRGTIWHLKKDAQEPEQAVVDQLIDFTWYGGDQNYNFFIDLERGEKSDESEQSSIPTYLKGAEPYSVDDIIASGVFLNREQIERMLKKLDEKKSIIIQGPPGVGKTFIARKLAFALIQEKDNKRIEFIQFHQSYSYDDFIRGYRPAEEAGLFRLQNGIFFEFCEKARNNPDSEYVFIIDEINRGNLSQIFGEVLMLIERDKRGKDFSVPLVYRKEGEPRFSVPSNLYLIGLMNLADRSLAMVDYALRRRFGFITLVPEFTSDIYRDWLTERSMRPDLIELIIEKLSALNQVIYDDPVLGENYQIGHSYFCPRGDDFSGLDKEWYESIIRTEIIPLLKEYWFDNQSKVEDVKKSLLS